MSRTQETPFGSIFSLFSILCLPTDICPGIWQTLLVQQNHETVNDRTKLTYPYLQFTNYLNKGYNYWFCSQISRNF